MPLFEARAKLTEMRRLGLRADIWQHRSDVAKAAGSYTARSTPRAGSPFRTSESV